MYQGGGVAMDARLIEMFGFKRIRSNHERPVMVAR